MRAKPWLKTDGSDWHVKPSSDHREYGTRDGHIDLTTVVREEAPCSLCGYPEGTAWPHRKHPKGGWERIADTVDGHGVRVYVPPAGFQEIPPPAEYRS
jgi:hypothetical protein